MDKKDKVYKVCIVDDQEAPRVTLAAMLTREGYRVIGQARSGTQAIQICTAKKPDILFCDINMQGMSGHEVLQTIRSSLPDIRVIIITADATIENIQATVDKDAHGFIKKPFSAKQVLSTAAKVLKDNSTMRDRGVLGSKE